MEKNKQGRRRRKKDALGRCGACLNGWCLMLTNTEIAVRVQRCDDCAMLADDDEAELEAHDWFCHYIGRLHRERRQRVVFELYVEGEHAGEYTSLRAAKKDGEASARPFVVDSRTTVLDSSKT